MTKKLSYFAATFVAIAAAIGLSFKNVDFINANVDVTKSVVTWKGYKVTGEHTGTVNLKSGQLLLEKGAFTGGSFELDMTSIKNTDMEGGGATKLEGHLKSDDFFGVATYPTAKLVITKVVSRGTPGAYKVVANLTIKETTKEIKFDATVTEGVNEVSASTNIRIDRSDFNIKYGSGSFFDGLGDKTIYDEFDLSVNLVAKK